MNVGVLSWIIWSMVIILLVFGWKRELVSSISYRLLIGLLITWFITMIVGGVWLLIMGIGIASFLYVYPREDRGLVISSGIILGCIHLMLSQLYFNNPLFPMQNVYLQVSVPILLLVLLLLRDFYSQLTAVSIALGLSYFLFHSLNHSVNTILKDVRLQDEWWLILGVVRILSISIQQCIKSLSNYHHRLK